MRNTGTVFRLSQSAVRLSGCNRRWAWRGRERPRRPGDMSASTCVTGARPPISVSAPAERGPTPGPPGAAARTLRADPASDRETRERRRATPSCRAFSLVPRPFPDAPLREVSWVSHGPVSIGPVLHGPCDTGRGPHQARGRPFQAGKHSGSSQEVSLPSPARNSTRGPGPQLTPAGPLLPPRLEGRQPYATL